jgi:glycosyltransferase involved in cell wall biosynthesis
MKSRPEVTVAIPFRNPGAFLELAIRSVFAQTHQDWELILLDDGSSDGAREFAGSIEDDRVRVYHDGQFLSLPARLNQAIALARGRYFLRMDADDVMHPERIAHQVSLLRQCDDDTVAGSSVYSIDADSRVHGIRGYPAPAGQGFAARHAFIHPTIGAATSWFAKHGYDPKFRRSEDAELYCRTAPVTNFVVTPEAWLYYREVGLFNIAKQLETHMGLLQILRRDYARPRLPYVAHVSMEAAKIWTYMVADAFGRIDLLYRRHLPASERERAARGLEIVRNQALPVRGGRVCA